MHQVSPSTADKHKPRKGGPDLHILSLHNFLCASHWESCLLMYLALLFFHLCVHPCFSCMWGRAYGCPGLVLGIFFGHASTWFIKAVSPNQTQGLLTGLVLEASLFWPLPSEAGILGKLPATPNINMGSLSESVYWSSVLTAEPSLQPCSSHL